MNLQKKMIVFSTVISTLALFILGGLSFLNYYTNSQKEMKTNTKNMLNRVILDIDDTIDEIDIFTEKIQFYAKSSYNLMDDLKQYTTGTISASTLFDTRTETRNIFQTLLYRQDQINLVALITPGGHIFSYSNSINDLVTDYSPYEDQWYQETLKAKGDLYISVHNQSNLIINAGDNGSLFFSRAIYDFYTGEFLAVLLVESDPAIFNAITKTDADNIVDFQISKQHSPEVLFNRNNSDSRSSSFVRKESIVSQHYPLKLTTYVDTSTYYEILFNSIKVILILVLLIFTITFFAFYLFSKRFTYPIKELSTIMRKNSAEKKYYLHDSSFMSQQDEIGVLYREYDHLVETLNRYMEETLAYEQALLTSQINVYRNQIDSHFLYNTLESINSVAEIADIEEISTMTLALSKMFRYASNGFVQDSLLGNELQNVNDFLKIQEIRYQRSFNYMVTLDSNQLKLAVVPKLILQPLIENAIFHGLNKGSLPGDILLDVSHSTSTLRITVTDTGLGLSPDRLAAVQGELASALHNVNHAESHIGLLNIQTRLVLAYGTDYGVQLASTHRGTVVTLLLPLALKGDSLCTPI
ncbi:histidine kinase [Vagococcus sp. BWB3-3]|uniref:Histidine kinase n=1 Tax=Vagococcus allomyrinae TaxID=2794353 RepID=A0A940SVF6_9ENTE|nr:histidine kinase [Vagococcus allomyrinae]MBP1040273.1 histidine kinase [Vagococcus allomyrinae]